MITQEPLGDHLMKPSGCSRHNLESVKRYPVFLRGNHEQQKVRNARVQSALARMSQGDADRAMARSAGCGSPLLDKKGIALEGVGIDFGKGCRIVGGTLPRLSFE